MEVECLRFLLKIIIQGVIMLCFFLKFSVQKHTLAAFSIVKHWTIISSDIQRCMYCLAVNIVYKVCIKKKIALQFYTVKI